VTQDDVQLAVKHLAVAFDTDQGQVTAVDDVSFTLNSGRTLGIAGESGCGKSVTALSLMRLLPKPVSRIMGGQILYRGEDLLLLPPEQIHRIRGKRISMIFQEPMTALNPVHSVGRQMSEVFELHFKRMPANERTDKSLSLIERVGIADPAQVLKKYPHQLSGGLRQRIMIAMALACAPDILIADEPTTALDVTVQAQIMALIRELRKNQQMSVILITHDLGLIAENCEDVVVMYAGRVAETAPAGLLFKAPLHPYTQGLLSSIPSRAKSAKTLLPTIPGTVPCLGKMPEGCRFAGRCPMVAPICQTQVPDLRKKGQDRYVACHFA
jgi:peptide/nickel transport system ATP-binding protein